jgi:hypothetical protein
MNNRIILYGNSIEGLGNTKGSYPSNDSTVEKLIIFPRNVPIQNMRIVMMKKLITIKNIKRLEQLLLQRSE